VVTGGVRRACARSMVTRSLPGTMNGLALRLPMEPANLSRSVPADRAACLERHEKGERTIDRVHRFFALRD